MPYFHAIISAGGYTEDPKNIISISSKLKKKPASAFELENILGLVKYFQRQFQTSAKLLTHTNRFFKEKPFHSQTREITNRIARNSTSSSKQNSTFRDTTNPYLFRLQETFHIAHRWIKTRIRLCIVSVSG